MNQPSNDATPLWLMPRDPDPGSRPGSPDGRSFRPGLLAIVPSWLFSLMLHAALLLALAASLPGLHGGIVGDPDGDLRSVGIWVGHSGDGNEGDGGSKGSSRPAAGDTKVVPTIKSDLLVPPLAEVSSPPRQPTLPATSETLIAPPEKISLAETPAAALPVIGPGGRPDRPGLFQRSVEPRASEGQTGSPTSKSGTGRRGPRGSTPFFGIVDIGSRFVYVIDCSGSMYSHNAMGAAKNELLKSLRTLNRFQQFQIVFYNTDQKWLKVAGKVDFRFFSADDKSLRLASDFITEVEPEGGTQHLTALELGLRLHPDVIFFLTDGGKPGLSDSDIESLKRLNERHTRIHCVQFSTRDDPDAALATDFLRKLSVQSDGEYVCRDVSQFEMPSATREVARPRGEER
jgi:hypothetical protein